MLRAPPTFPTPYLPRAFSAKSQNGATRLVEKLLTYAVFSVKGQFGEL